MTEGELDRVEGSCQPQYIRCTEITRRAAACAQTHQFDGSLHQGGMLGTVRSTGVAIRNRRHALFLVTLSLLSSFDVAECTS